MFVIFFIVFSLPSVVLSQPTSADPDTLPPLSTEARIVVTTDVLPSEPAETGAVETEPVETGTTPADTTTEAVSSEATATTWITTSINPDDGTVLYRLTSKECETAPEGRYRNMELDGYFNIHEGFRDNITCKMTKVKDCEDVLQSMLNSTGVYVGEYGNGSALNYTRRIVSNHTDEDYVFEIIFEYVVSHKHHHKRKVYCMASADSLEVVSTHDEFSPINRNHEVEILDGPGPVIVEVGSTYQLTCQFKDNDGLSKKHWSRKQDVQDTDYRQLLNGTDGVTIIQDEENLISTITIPGSPEWKGSYKCTTKYHLHGKYDEVKVLVKPKDERALYGTTISLIIMAIVVVLIVVILFIRRRELKKKIQITNRLMQIQEQGERERGNQQAQMGSAHSLNMMEPAVNCYANSGLAMESEALAMTLQRFTQTYGVWQKDRNKLSIKHILGEGNFGSVCLGIMADVIYQGISSQVAVKTIKPTRLDKNAIIEFEKEISVMTSLQHENIISLIGLCTEMMPLYIIMEYMPNGELNEFLITKAPNKLEETTLTALDLLYIGIQPSKALEYLSEKNVVHRDISARNCLVGENLMVKLADFGLSRGTAVDDGKNYYKKDGGMVPVKWMAPEALNFGKYTTANDVWSMGVLLWEIFSFGAIPYLTQSNQQVIVYVNRGGRLEKPQYCPQRVWEIVCLCWEHSPDDRVAIGGLVNLLSTELEILKDLSDP